MKTKKFSVGWLITAIIALCIAINAISNVTKGGFVSVVSIIGCILFLVGGFSALSNAFSAKNTSGEEENLPEYFNKNSSIKELA